VQIFIYNVQPLVALFAVLVTLLCTDFKFAIVASRDPSVSVVYIAAFHDNSRLSAAISPSGHHGHDHDKKMSKSKKSTTT